MNVLSSRILVFGQELATLEEISRLLQQPGHEVATCCLGATEPDDLQRYQMLVLDATGCQQQSLELCRRLRARLTDGFLPLLFITDDTSPGARLASLEAGADTYLLRPFADEELHAQVRAFLRIKEVHDRLSEKTAEVHRINHRLQQAYQQIDEELQLAHRLQLSFLPQKLPDIPPLRFAVHYFLCGQVGGDFYDVFRLDENHVGFYVADAMGHGVPASLLTIFVKKGVQAKEVFGQQYRLVPPGEVLYRLNRELIEQKLSENPFITMVYVLFNHQDGTVRFSRAGHPYPLLVPREGELELWQGEGLLLGVFESKFSDSTYRLQPGDKLLLYSDGVDSARFEHCAAGVESLLACAAKNRSLPIKDFVDTLVQDLFREGNQPDDLTLLGLEMLSS